MADPGPVDLRGDGAVAADGRLAPVLRLDVLVDDPDPVLAWMEARRHPDLVRGVAWHTVAGWHVKVAIRPGPLADAFRDAWGTHAAPAGQAELRARIARRRGGGNK